MRRFLIALCLVLSLTLTLTTQPSLAQSSAQQPTGTIAVDDGAGDDSAIARRIREILAQLDGFGDVTVDVSSGIVTLGGKTADAERTRQLDALVNRIEGVVAIENDVVESTDVGERLTPVIDRFSARLAQMIAFLPLMAIALAMFILITVFGFFIASRRQPWDRISPNGFIADIYRQIVRLLAVIGALVIALDILGATALLSGILGAAGLVGLAIGFAVRDSVENFIASVMLSIRQPFSPNDTVEIEGDIGKVIRLTSRATILLSYDGNHIRIPNATVFKSRIINYTRNAERRFFFELGMAPDTDFAAAQALALEVLQDLPFLLKEPEPGVWIETIGDNTVSLQITGWINQDDSSFSLARGEAIRLVMAAFDAAGHAMPEPTFRIVSPDDTQSPDSAPAEPSPRKAQAPAAPVRDVAAKADKALAQIVDQERASTDKDLLGKHGTQE